MWLYQFVWWAGWKTGQIDEQSIREYVQEFLDEQGKDPLMAFARTVGGGVLTPAERRMAFIEGLSDSVAPQFPESLRDTLLPIVEDEARKWVEARW